MAQFEGIAGPYGTWTPARREAFLEAASRFAVLPQRERVERLTALAGEAGGFYMWSDEGRGIGALVSHHLLEHDVLSESEHMALERPFNYLEWEHSTPKAAALEAARITLGDAFVERLEQALGAGADTRTPRPPAIQRPSRSLFTELAESNPLELLRLVQNKSLEPATLTYAAEALGGATGQRDEVIGTLLKLLDHESFLVREGAVYGLQSHCDDPRVRQRLKVTLDTDSSIGVREAALEALEIEGS